MQTAYKIHGMHCENCAQNIKKALANVDSLESITIDVPSHIATITSTKSLDSEKLNQVLERHKLTYQLEKIERSAFTALVDRYYNFFKPYLLQSSILLIIFLISFIPYFQGRQHIHQAMNMFMGLFLIIFAAFKFYNLQGFAASFARYDIIAKKSKGYALAYPFIELALGIGCLFNLYPYILNIITLIIMSIGSIGVWQALHSKQKIQCACLGTRFNLPLSYLTLFENLIMVAMAFYMLLTL